MNWFGNPWPSEELRAPVCEDDADRVPPPPPGEDCILCGNPIEEGARGVMMPHLTADKTSPWISWHEVRYSHIECLIGNAMGKDWPFDLG